ncbi:MAG: PstS family phosphate ABC transporter substrate-binding protein [Burkholderiales bacterium]|jgi:phosphate transport system substrate-binding protein|nr:PstS family phosphate ABC transporter substrate-binding protein [Burkholderiales bacterium]
MPRGLFAVPAAVIVALGATLHAAPVAAQETIRVDGSSTVFPITEAVAEEFQASKKNKVRVTVGISGTGGGFKKFCRGETDVSNASRPILAREMEECKRAGVAYIELPVAYDALTVVMNPKNDWIKPGITVAELRTMWEPAAQGKIMKWKQVNAAWPDTPMKLFGAGADSGTFDYFTEAVNGRAKASRGDFTASEDDNTLVQGVARDTNGIGYFGYAYYIENKDKLKAVPVINPKSGKPVEPSETTVLDGSYQPLARPIFIYINAKAIERPEVRDFVQFYMKQAGDLVKEVRYVPLPAKAYEHNLSMVERKVVGTKFGGENKVGLTIEDLMKLEAKL